MGNEQIVHQPVIQ